MPSAPGQESQQWQYPAGYDYQSYYAAWQNYQSQQYYGYDQNYANYSSYYQQQPFASYPGYEQPPYPVEDEASATSSTADATTTASSTETTARTETESEQTVPTAQERKKEVKSEHSTPRWNEQYYTAAAYEPPDNVIEEHDIPLNKELANQETINRNEDLFDALDESRWLPLEGLDPPYGKVKDRN